MGGIKVKVDFTLDSYSDFDNLAMLIMPGGLSWEGNSYDEIANFVKEIREQKVSISAICGATYFLCQHGFFNAIKHTSESLGLF